MTASLRISRAGPSATLQDAGRFGMLQHGISASGPMDAAAFAVAGRGLAVAGAAGIELARAGIDFVVERGAVAAAFAGGTFRLRIDGEDHAWPSARRLVPGTRVEITPGAAGNFGYVRFDHDIGVPPVLGSRATNLVAGLGGLEGRALRAGDVLPLEAVARRAENVPAGMPAPAWPELAGPIRFVWGIHADTFPSAVRETFVGGEFSISSRIDRMGFRLADDRGVFAGTAVLSLVSDAIVPGDIQILGDGTPIVLMRDHQPTGGYPRIGTVISADLDRVAQMRPGTPLAFAPVTLQKARELYLASRSP
jgi:biotin-dependent carboxylase-like uncharacterized protein